MSTVFSSDEHYKRIGNKIRNVLGGTYTPSEMPNAILNMAQAFDEIQVGAIYNGSNIMQYFGDQIYPGEFASSSITTFDVPINNTKIPNCCFINSKLNNINLHNNITAIGDHAFELCENLIEITLPNTLTSIGESAFSRSGLTKIDIPSGVSMINSQTFYSCANLEIVIMRKTDSICTLRYDSAFDSTPIAKTDTTQQIGYIYVPSALVSSYKSNSNWSTYKDKFRAIEDYPDICGTT